MKKFNAKLTPKHVLVFIILLGFFLRFYKFRELFMYSHDQDLWAWVIRDILENGHIRLIGQQTSIAGVFIGALYYYLLIPFVLLTGMDPIGGVFLSIGLGIFAIYSVYFVFTKMFSSKVGLIGAFIHATSFNTVLTEREVVPTMPVMLWSVWIMYALWLIMKGNQKRGFILAALLSGFIWHINLGLALTLVLVPFAWIVSRKKLEVKSVLLAGVSAIVANIPILVFEIRHNFQQMNAILSSSVSQGVSEFHGGFAKFDRVMLLVSKNVTGLIWGNTFSIPMLYVFVGVMTLFLLLTMTKKLSPKISIIFGLWIVLFIAFFSANSIIVSEYYLNGMTIVWIAILAVAVDVLIASRHLLLASGFITFFGIVNVYRVLSIPVNKSGYVERKAIVEEIKRDSLAHGYPCVSVSYITMPGYELGYRYLFYIADLHVNKPDSGSPVYSIVFPHSMVDKIDKSLGALGLIYPDYERYTDEMVQYSCSGENTNLTDSLFGFTP